MSKKRKFVSARARPIDKILAYVKQSGVDATQVETSLISAPFPCTITGIRWEIGIAQSGGTGLAQCDMAIVVVREGNSTIAISTVNTSQFYEPEQNCLAFKTVFIHNFTQTKQWSGSTKTMRKLMVGDQIRFVMLGIATNTVNISGVVQLFCMT